MKRTLTFCAFALLTGTSLAHAGGASTGTCTATTYMQDGMALTAALINPGNVSGDVNATGCNIGVYYSKGAQGHVIRANVHGSNYYGILNNGGNVNVEGSSISEIGDTPFDGDQHGVGIYWVGGSGARGNIIGNFVWAYQKDGIAVHGPNATSSILNNNVIGLGPVNFIAQNGIEVGLGAETFVQGNLISGNSYTGPNGASSGGILLYGGAFFGGPTTVNTVIQQNTGLGNDVGIFMVNLDSNGNPVTTPTKNAAFANALINNLVDNISGDGPGQGYQAGILDQGDQDVIIGNYVCGLGYTSPSTPTAFILPIDTTDTNHPVVADNIICPSTFAPATANVASANVATANVAAAPAATGHPQPSPIK
jgi:hypothetical protein